MTEKSGIANFLSNMLKVGAPPERKRPLPSQPTNVAGQALPEFNEAPPADVHMLTVKQPDGRLSQYPPSEYWDNWVEYDGKSWPQKIARRYMLVPTVCFNCESACGLLAYVDKTTLEIKKFEGNPKHPGSRGRNCAKGPATHNQIYDPERILYPLKRLYSRPEGGQRIFQFVRYIGGKGLNRVEPIIERRGHRPEGDREIADFIFSFRKIGDDHAPPNPAPHLVRRFRQQMDRGRDGTRQEKGEK